MPILGIGLKVSITHQLIVFQDCDPATLRLALFSIRAWFRLFDGDRVSVEVLKDDVVEEGGLLLLLVELQLDVGLARLLLHSHGLVRDQAVHRHDVELLLI